MVSVCLRYGAHRIDEEPKAGSNFELVFLAIAVNMAALNVLKYEKRLTSE
jgi:hypothetical protein